MTGRPFRFGVVAAQASSGDEWVLKARHVESLGYAMLGTPDGLRHTLAPLPALTAAAVATESLRMTTYVIANDFRNPVLLTKEAATVDVLSGGRFELGMGVGRPAAAEDNQMLGISFDSGAAREADIIALGIAPTETETKVAEMVGWIREAASPRFDQLELNVNLMAVGEQVPRWITGQMGLTAEDLARSGAATAIMGSTQEMCEQLVRRRERLGISYVMVSDELMEAFAPVVERLAGH